jgi:hypothetical protein
MATDNTTTCLAQIGETAGIVWKTLADNGPMNLTKLVKAVDEPRDMVLFAVGWLAREDKLSIDEDGRSRIVSLR